MGVVWQRGGVGNERGVRGEVSRVQGWGGVKVKKAVLRKTQVLN